MLSVIFKGNAELLSSSALLDDQGNHLLSNGSDMQLLRTRQRRDFDASCEQNFDSLDCSDLLSVSEELLHAVVELGLEEVFEGVLHSELLVGVRQQADVDDGHQVLALLRGRASHDNDEILFCLRPQLQRDSLRELFGNRVFNIPRLILYFAVHNIVTLFAVVSHFRVNRKRQLGVVEFLCNGFFVKLEAVRINRKLNDLLARGKVSDVDG